jgi:hypothetical protein
LVPPGVTARGGPGLSRGAPIRRPAMIAAVRTTDAAAPAGRKTPMPGRSAVLDAADNSYRLGAVVGTARRVSRA